MPKRRHILGSIAGIGTIASISGSAKAETCDIYTLIEEMNDSLVINFYSVQFSVVEYAITMEYLDRESYEAIRESCYEIYQVHPTNDGDVTVALVRYT